MTNFEQIHFTHEEKNNIQIYIYMMILYIVKYHIVGQFGVGFMKTNFCPSTTSK